MTQISQPHVWFTTSEGGGGRFAYLSHVLDTYDLEKKKKTMKQHQTYQTPKQRHRGIFFTPSESGRQSRRAIFGGASTAKERVSRFRSPVAGISKGVESSKILVHLTAIQVTQVKIHTFYHVQLAEVEVFQFLHSFFLS